MNQQSFQGVPVCVLSNEQDLVDKELSVQELARAVLTHI